MNIDDFIHRLGNRPLYHFTDERNLPSIRQHGLLSRRQLAARGIDPPHPGGNELSRRLDDARGITDFVHLTLVTDHPMAYCACQEGRIGSVRYLRISPSVLRREGVRGTSGTSNGNGSRILRLEFALDEMDLDVLLRKAEGCGVPDWAFRERFDEARKAEFLVPKGISPQLIPDFE